MQKQYKIMQPKESKTSRHFRISVLKSGIRMIGCGVLMFGNVFAAGCLLFAAECFGILEEL
jgi:hypothetical protein